VARRAAAQTIINAILDALASLGIAHIHITGHDATTDQYRSVRSAAL